MSAEGRYLGGIRVLDDLRARCFVDEETGCWHCKMMLQHGLPMVVIWMADGTKQKMYGRRASLYLRDGKMPPKGHIAFAQRKCQSKDCVNPEHTRSASKKIWGEEARKLGVLKGRPAKIAASRANGIKRRALTDEQVIDALASPESAVVTARRLGVSRQLISSLRRGERYHPVHRNSVFSWRPA